MHIADHTGDQIRLIGKAIIEYTFGLTPIQGFSW